VATGNRKIRNFLTPVAAIFFLSFIGLLIVAFLQLDKFLDFPKLFPSSLSIVLSVPILTIGLFLILWSILHFGKAKGTPVPFNPPPKLVTTGPYAYIRNPIHTGMFILFFGLGILFRSISLVFIFTPLVVLLTVLGLRAIEEPELEKRLGKEYLEYKKRVPMFIPRLKVRTKK
jgi:protein-S-isoprenylcysteine O-methyltransferase Ste14